MQIIKLDATDSTNTYLKNLLHNNKTDDYIVVVAKEQLQGKGQRGSFWISESGKNLTFSVLKRHNNVSALDSFAINRYISIALINCLNHFSIPNLSIKWPNVLTGKTFDLDELLDNLLKELKLSFLKFSNRASQESLNDYEKFLFRKDILSKFIDIKNQLFRGTIRGITKEGKLIVELDGGANTEFDFKEVQFVY